MIHLLWFLPLALLCWCVVRGGTRKQMPPVQCRDCTWYAPVDSNPAAQKIHDILDSGNETGVCRKFTFTENRPVMTRPDGYCHRAERREADE